MIYDMIKALPQADRLTVCREIRDMKLGSFFTGLVLGVWGTAAVWFALAFMGKN